ncbi:hypothetical protein BH10ACT8_BH10ACT8_19850 [soil metagenome]|jgi:hypothetical protein
MKRVSRLTAVTGAALLVVSLGLASAFAAGGNGAPARAVPDAKAQPALTALNNPRPPARPESIFVPIRPCRIADTRHGGGRLVSGATRNFYVRGTFGFAPQGGVSGGCGVPANATAVALNTTVTGASSDGYLNGYPAGTAAPVGTITTYWHDRTVTTNPVLALAAIGTEPSLTIKNFGGPAHVILDVAGYYVLQIAGMVDPNGGIFAGSSRLVSATHTGLGTYTVTVDSDVSYCTPTVTAYSGYVFASAYNFNGTAVQVTLWYLDSTTHLPTGYDGYFYLTVNC